MLMDPEGYSAWESHMVARCAEDEWSPEVVLATLARDAARVRRWKPNGQTLTQAIAALPREPADAHAPVELDESLRVHEQVMAAVPDDLKPAANEHGLESAFQTHVRSALPAYGAPLKRYLAAKAFASWTAYQGKGIATIVRGLDAALAFVRVEASRQCRDARRGLDADLLREAIRSADFALNHLAVGEDLAKAWSAVED